MKLNDRQRLSLNRRAFLGKSVRGIGSLALASLLNPTQLMAQATVEDDINKWRGVITTPYVPPKAKRIIHLCMAGGPSHLETFDYKPRLAELDGQPMPASFTEGQPIAQLQGATLKCLAPQYGFQRHGQSGQEISDALPHIAKIADDICIVRSMVTEQINHDTAHTLMNTGFRVAGRPSMGSWTVYGLGSDAENLPGFVVLTSEGGAQGQPIAARQWSSGFLPSVHQGVKFNSAGDPVNYVRNPAGIDREMQGELIDTVGKLNGFQGQMVADPEIQTRIAQYELAFRMQMAVPELTDFSSEPESIREMYGDGPF
ncbi:MAG: DUF1501 domain-containing protein, partial [Candidatus Poribacteria bacterium]|nr:DUF1501 domain-containing protein [Candidatus Poribacteria bacterium]